MSDCRQLSLKEKLYFVNRLREARTEALKDAEGYQKVLHTIEKMGSHLSRDIQALNNYEECIYNIACKSPYANYIPCEHPSWHTSFERLYEITRHARNDAMHQGVVARYMTNNLVVIALVLEDALMQGATKIADIMVRGVVVADEWQPVSFVRQQMLVSSFSYIPVYLGGWKLISDSAIVKYLNHSNYSERKRRLISTVGEAINKGLQAEKAKTVGPNAKVSKIKDKWSGKPILVTEGRRLVGIVTSFDLL